MAVGDFPLGGKIVAITGGGSGISLAFAQLAATKGSRVILADIRLVEAAEELVRANSDVVFVRCDVTVWNDLQNIITFSQAQFNGVPDVYIAGAGVFESPEGHSFWSDTEASRYSILDVNLHPLKLTRIAIKALLGQNKKGVVLILSSVAGLYPLYPTPLYNATKHALVGFVKGLKPAEEEEGVKVLCACPAIVQTPLWTSVLREQWSYSPDNVLPPSKVAEWMLELVQEERYPGGTISVMTAEQGHVVLEQEDYWSAIKPVLEKSYEPIREVLRKERGSH